MRLHGLCAMLGVLMLASPGFAEAAAKAKPESYPAFLTQVASGKVKTAVLVPKRKRLRARLQNGDRYVVKYKAADKRHLLTTLHAKKVHVAFAKPKKKHKSRIRRRYIALAVVGLGLLAVAGWFLTGRRRGGSGGGRGGGSGSQRANTM
jgi:ATP-dependent Zn protease